MEALCCGCCYSPGHFAHALILPPQDLAKLQATPSAAPAFETSKTNGASSLLASASSSAPPRSKAEAPQKSAAVVAPVAVEKSQEAPKAESELETKLKAFFGKHNPDKLDEVRAFPPLC